MDVNVKNLEPDVVARLAEQAAAEGLSRQEWLREVLRRTAARLSPAELVAQRERLTPMTEPEFAELRRRLATRKVAGGEGHDARQRRR